MTQLPPDYVSTTSPYNYDQPLPPVARTNAVTQVPPAKKITFYKSGDPQFGGVKMAINQRSFKSFNALMDDLSHRVPLPFGVRTITTPKGIHCISTLDQLEDGGCYLCSDKKYVTPISIGAAGQKAGPPKNGQPANDLRRAAQEVKSEDYSTAFTQQRLRIPKKITLVKNGDVAIRRPIILNRRNARSFKTLLDEISEIMQFTVKKLYTVDGKKIDSMQALLHCPNVLICVGRELFKPIVTEDSRKPSAEKLPSLTSQSNSHVAGENNEMFGLKAKKSVIHPRSSRSMRFSLSSEKSYPNGLTTSSENGASCSNNCPHSKPGDMVCSLVNDDIEKRVHVNKDGSLSVEMKVRFRLLNDETLQWSTQIKKSSVMNVLPCEESGIDEDNGVDLTEKSNPEASSEVDDSLYPCDADSYISKLDESENEETHCHNCGKPCKDYDIWKNPLHTSQKEEPGVRNTWYTHSSCSSTSSHRRIVCKKTVSDDSIRTSSSGEEYSKHVVQESSCYSETVENRVGYDTIRKCCCQCDCIQTNTSQQESPEEPELVACSVNSQNEEDDPGEATMVQGGDGSPRSRAGSSKSKSSQGSVESQIKVCEETSSGMRSASSCSVRKGEVDVGCSSSPNSVYSRSSVCSLPIAKDSQGDVSENDQVILSFSSESCTMKDAGEYVEKEEEAINVMQSMSENIASSQSVKDKASECGRCSTESSSHCKTCNGKGRRTDSDEVHMCSAASSSSKRSRRSRKHLETGSKASAESSVTSASREKKTKSSLRAEDARSNSRASYYSRSSQEVEKRASEGHASHDSSSPHSNVSSLSEAAAPPAFQEDSTSSISKCYSKSSKSSQKWHQQEDTSKASSPCSKSSDCSEKNGSTPVGSQTQSASMSKSTCSKCGRMTKTRNDDLQSVHSRVSSSQSEVKSTYAETEASGRSGNTGSQSSMAQSSKPRRKKKNSLHAEVEHSSRASASGSASVYSLHCPVPPKGRPSSKKGRTVVLRKNSNAASVRAESEPTADKQQKEKASSQAPEMDMAKGEEEEGSCHQKSQGGDALEDCEEVIPSFLPNTSPEEVVHEWLRKIPSVTLPMKDEMQDEGSTLDLEISSCSGSQEPLEEELGEKKEDTEGCKSTPADEAEVKGAEEEALDEEGNKDPSDEKVSEVMSEGAEGGTAECNHSVISSHNHKKDLPSTIQTSVQIMKALLASKQEAKLDRSHSLPEVSPTMGRKLSNSANILITCLASLQLLDEQLGPSNKPECLRKPRYTEILNIFQALWFGCASEKSGPSSGHHGEVQEKVAAGFKGHNTKDGDFTPMSSSGVDVSSGDGGSGEGSVAGMRDCALSPEKTGEANVEEEEEDSQLPTSCSKSEGGEKAESTGGEEVAEAPENLGNDCEIGQEEEKEITEEKEEEMEATNNKEEDGNAECEENNAEADVVQEEAQEEIVVAEAEVSPSQEKADEATAEPSDHEANPNANEANKEGEHQSNAEKQLVGADLEPKNTGPHQAIVKTTPPITEQQSIDPDPVWVLKLLKKIEKEFLTHYVSAMNDFKAKWNLPNSKELDVMIAELKEEVSRRIEQSIEVELRKIRSRAGKRIPRPPDDGPRQESALQAGHRRRRLQSLQKIMSLFSNRNRTQSKRPESRDSSLGYDEGSFLFRTTVRDGLNEQPSEDEYCPCDACIKKKMAARSTLNTVVVTAAAPVVKAFDLQQILRMKKGNVADREAEAESAQGAEGEEATSRKLAGTASAPEENQELAASVEGEPGEASEPEGKVAQAPAGGEEVPANPDCEEEVEGEKAGSKEVEEEVREEVEEGNKEEEGIVEEENEHTENEKMGGEGEEETLKEEDNEKEEAKEEEVEEEEEDKEEEAEAKEEEEKEVEEAVKEEVEEAESKEEEEAVKEGKDNEEEETKEEEESVKEEDKQEQEEAKEEEVEEEEENVKEEEDKEEEAAAAKEEEVEEGEEEAKEVEEAEAKEEEGTVKEEEEAKEEEVEEAEEKQEEEIVKEEVEAKEEEVEEEDAKEEELKEAEEEAKEEEETVKEEEDVEEEEEAKEEEVEEPEAKEEGESVKEEEEAKEEEDAKEEEMDEEDASDEDVKEEAEKEEDVEEEDKKAEEEVDPEADQEGEAKREGEGEVNEAEHKDVGQEHEATHSEETEEDPKIEGDTDGAAEELEPGAGGGCENAPEGAETGAEGVEVSEAEAEGGAEEAGEEARAGGRETSEEGPSPEAASLEAAGVEDEGAVEESGEAEGKGEDSGGAVQKDREEDRKDGTIEGAQALRNDPAFSRDFSMGNCSQQSQKGSEDGSDGDDCKEDGNANSDSVAGSAGAKTHTQSKSTNMYPKREKEEEEEEEEEEDGASSQTSAVKGGESQTDANEDGQAPKKENENSEAIDQDDLDF